MSIGNYTLLVSKDLDKGEGIKYSLLYPKLMEKGIIELTEDKDKSYSSTPSFLVF